MLYQAELCPEANKINNLRSVTENVMAFVVTPWSRQMQFRVIFSVTSSIVLSSRSRPLLKSEHMPGLHFHHPPVIDT